MSQLVLLSSRGHRSIRNEPPRTKKQSTKQFTFLVETEKPEPTVPGKVKAIINSHIAKQAHDKRKARQELSEQEDLSHALGNPLDSLDYNRY